jgi:hypothetical protein
MQEFFAKTGNTKLKFKPAFNPYTEVCPPSFWASRGYESEEPHADYLIAQYGDLLIP